MEKNTKILLGIGAVIVAYLIFKPKKVSAKIQDCNNLDKTSLDLFNQAQSHYVGGIGPSIETENRYQKLRADANKKINELGLDKCYNDWYAEYQKKEMENFNIHALPQ